MFPWGSSTPDCTIANFRIIPGGPGANGTCQGDTTAEGTYAAGASPYGVMDMSGNVWEWVGDYYDSQYYWSSPSVNPQGPTMGTGRVIRGGSWYSTDRYGRDTYRGKDIDPFTWLPWLGIRCVK